MAMNMFGCIVFIFFLNGLNLVHMAHGEGCNRKDLTGSGNIILACIESESAGLAKQCWVSNGIYEETFKCENGVFTSVDVNLLESLVMQCEEEEEDCPYTEEELDNYYKKMQSDLAEEMTEDELDAKKALEEELESLPLDHRGSICPAWLCCRRSNGNYLYPQYCRQLPSKFIRACNTCRRANCGQVSGAFTSSSINSNCS